jgi:hypothetical protein
MNIILLCGHQQSGKTTIAHSLASELEGKGVQVAGFADAIREELFDGMREWFKAKGFYHPADLKRQEVKALTLPTGITVRQALQRIGAMWREIDPGHWIKALYELSAKCCHDVLIVPDCRMLNEAEDGRKRGGIVIKLTRHPVKDDDITESEVDLIVPNFTIDNAAMSEAQANEAAMAIAMDYLAGREQ